MPASATVRSATDFDQRLGALIRLRRHEAGLSQEKLAEAVGLTFQQVQKYEKAVNRISAGRLVDVARALGTTAAALIGDLEAVDGVEATPLPALSADDIHIARQIRALKPETRRGIVTVIGKCADADGAAAAERAS